MDDYKELFKKGIEFQNFVCEKLGLTAYENKWEQFHIGETKEGVEIKFDDLMEKTGNIYFEVAEKSIPGENLPWIQSGICRNDNSKFLLIGNYRKAYIFRILTMKEIFKKKQYDYLKEAKRGTSKGFVISIRRIENESLYERLIIWGER